MSRKWALATACLLFCSMFAFSIKKAGSWAYFHHGAMAEDSLRALGWSETEVTRIPDYANEVDDPINGLPHPEKSNHRVEKYQRVFESYGGENCSFVGAEKWASEFAEQAKIAYSSGDTELGKKNLGYAIHYIQDALCPPHVFPFSENLTDTAHWSFETYALTYYGILGNDWQTLVRNAPVEFITSAEDLCRKVEEAADWVNATFQPPRCSYIRQDGAIIGDLSGTPFGWKMSDEDIGKCIERAASLVKSAAIWAHPEAKKGTIYIRADGSIDPPTAPIITYDNITYTLIDNIMCSADGIVVGRNNIVIDGTHHTICGPETHAFIGVYLYERSNITIKNIEIKMFYSGIALYNSSLNTVFGNDINNNDCGISLSVYSNHNNIHRNNITASKYNGIYLSGTSNSNNSISWNNVKDNLGGGVVLHYAFNSVISFNSISNNYHGVILYHSSENSVFGNNIIENHYGVYMEDSQNNKFYHNNFVTSEVKNQIRGSSVNLWDDGHPSGGNFWNDHNNTDLDNDGLCDTPYFIDGNNIDYYPLAGMFSEFSATPNHTVQIVSNSTVSDFEFNGTAINFNVAGENDSIGFCRVCLPEEVMNGTFQVFVNGTEVSYTIIPSSDSTLNYIYFSYNHSIKEVIIIPEFSTLLFQFIFMATTFLGAIIYRKKSFESCSDKEKPLQQ